MKSQVEMDDQGGVTVLRLVGYFHAYEPALKEALGRIGGSKVVVDFSRCRFLGSGAVGPLLELAQRLRQRDGDVKVTGVSQPRSGTIHPRPMFEQYETVAQAVAAFH